MAVKLTQTERRVVEQYSKGLRPREIAEQLGISINTVYKALSKARKSKVLSEMPDLQYYVFTSQVYMYNTAPAAVYPRVVASAVLPVEEAYSAVVKKLDEIISLLKNERPAIKGVVEKRREEAFRAEENGNGHVPDALRKNVWISLLRSKALPG